VPEIVVGQMSELVPRTNAARRVPPRKRLIAILSRFREQDRMSLGAMAKGFRRSDDDESRHPVGRCQRRRQALSYWVC
jgi:hypothetical protein